MSTVLSYSSSYKVDKNKYKNTSKLREKISRKWFIANFECDNSRRWIHGIEKKAHMGRKFGSWFCLFLDLSHGSLSSHFIIDLLIVHAYFHLFFGG